MGESGIPVLSKIPIISFLVTRKAKVIQRRNLLILIRAEVLIPEEHAPGMGVR
jgi:type II secretory pathway component GspD/PulD (secretin)